MKSEIRFICPMEEQKITDIALHFKWTCGDFCKAYELELSDNEQFVDPVHMEQGITEKSDAVCLLPKEGLLPSHSGRWYARIREKGGGDWVDTVSFYVDDGHGHRALKRPVTAENPWFTVFDYSRHEPGEVWRMLPETLRPYTGIGLIASYEAPPDGLISYMLDEDAKGYPWHLGALGPHENQAGHCRVTTLSEIEYMLQHAENLVSVGFVEQYLGTKEEDYWRNHYFFRVLMLCAKYGVCFIYSDGNRNQMELAAMISRPFFMDRLREYADYLILSYKQNHSHSSYSCYGAILGAWMDSSCAQIGMQPENWYWNDAGFRDKTGECHGYLQGNEQQLPAGMAAEMLLTGLSLGCAHYSCEGESWLIEKGVDGRLDWSSQGREVLAFFLFVIQSRAIPSKKEVLSKLRAAVGVEAASLGDAWTGGILRNVFEPSWRIENGFELFLKEYRYYYLPLVTDRREVFSGLTVLDALKETDAGAVGKQLESLYPREWEGNACVYSFPSLLAVANSRENEDCAQWFSIPFSDGFLRRLEGGIGLWHYLIVKKERDGCCALLHAEPGKRLNIFMEFSCEKLLTACEGPLQLYEKGPRLEITLDGGRTGATAALAASASVEALAGLKNETAGIWQVYKGDEEESEIKGRLLSGMPFEQVSVNGNCLPVRDACANIRFGRLPLAPGHLRCRHGLSFVRGTRIVWRLGKAYKRLEFEYGFDMDAWLPRILDREHIIWDRKEKKIDMGLTLYGDGRKIFQSPPLVSTERTRCAVVSVDGVEQLELVFDGRILSEEPDAEVYFDLLNPLLT